MGATFSSIVEELQQLDTDCKQELVRLLQAWLVEERREEIRRNALESEPQLDQGTLKSGTVDELMADLYAQG